jgi:glycosyltransferase involved in cell wall biosynthesis
MRIALVHDWLNNLGGAERVLVELHKIFPKAPIYALFYNKKFVREFLPEAEIRTSSLQKFPFITKLYKYLFFAMPSAVESFDLSDFDLVISSSVIFSKGLVLKPKTRHICYCYSPTRVLWDRNSENENKGALAILSRHLLRIWDRQASDRVDEFVAISKHVQARIKKYYGKDSRIIYPPITIEEPLPLKARFGTNSVQPFYLIVSRLFPHKNIDVAIDAFNKLGYELIIIGDGPAKKDLKKMSGKNIKILGYKKDDEVTDYYRNCKAFIMPQEEDFGLTPVEAMSFGKPVLALRKGGALETIVEGVTGEFFDDPIPEALADGVRRLNENYSNYSPLVIQKWANKFSRDRFREEILSLTKTN